MERMTRLDRETETAWRRRGGLSLEQERRSTGLTRPCYPGNSMGELYCSSSLYGDWSMRVCTCVGMTAENLTQVSVSATIKCMALCGYAGAPRSTMEAHSVPKGRFIHSAQRNVSNPEVDALKGCINQKANELWSAETIERKMVVKGTSAHFVHSALFCLRKVII